MTEERITKFAPLPGVVEPGFSAHAPLPVPVEAATPAPGLGVMLQMLSGNGHSTAEAYHVGAHAWLR